jgi:hypothetical protein
MAEMLNDKTRFAVARVEVPAKRNDADALKPCHAGHEEFSMALPATFRRLPREQWREAIA